MADGYITTSTTSSGQPNNLRLDWSSSPNVSTNTTTITWILTQAYNGNITPSSKYRRTKNPIVKIRNSNNTDWDYEYTDSSYNVLYCYTGTQIATGATTISNNSDGTLGLVFSAEAQQWVDNKYIKTSGTGIGTADPIPRIYISDGSKWVPGAVYVSTGSAWSVGTPKVSTGSAWKP